MGAAINQDTHTFRPADELRTIYTEENGLRPDDEVIVYCRIGERSSHTWFALTHFLGFETVRKLRRVVDRVGQSAATEKPQQIGRCASLGWSITTGEKTVKAFYMRENPADPRTVPNNDMLAPEGYGEIIGGSQRADNYGKLVARIREEKLPEKAYGWYVDLRKYGTFVHAGVGLGVERTVAWICGIPHIREAIAFPRTLYKLWR